MFKIFIIDNHLLFQEGLANSLQQEPGMQVIGAADSIHKACEKLKSLDPDLALVDAGLPDLDEFYGIRRLRAHRPLMHIVLLSKEEAEPNFLEAMRNGVRGFITKNNSFSSLLTSIRAIERGEAAIPRAMVGGLLDELARLSPAEDREEINLLTPREIEVLGEVGRGQSNQQIARKLNIAENTVKVHVHNILDKLKLPNRRQAARYARSKGIAALDSQYRLAFFG